MYEKCQPLRRVSSQWETPEESLVHNLRSQTKLRVTGQLRSFDVLYTGREGEVLSKVESCEAPVSKKSESLLAVCRTTTH